MIFEERHPVPDFGFCMLMHTYACIHRMQKGRQSRGQRKRNLNQICYCYLRAKSSPAENTTCSKDKHFSHSQFIMSRGQTWVVLASASLPIQPNSNNSQASPLEISTNLGGPDSQRSPVLPSDVYGTHWYPAMSSMTHILFCLSKQAWHFHLVFCFIIVKIKHH